MLLLAQFAQAQRHQPRFPFDREQVQQCRLGFGCFLLAASRTCLSVSVIDQVQLDSRAGSRAGFQPALRASSPRFGNRGRDARGGRLEAYPTIRRRGRGTVRLISAEREVFASLRIAKAQVDI